jgi:hypothetical protein
MPPVHGPLLYRRNGYHLCNTENLIYHLRPVIYAAEYRGELRDHEWIMIVRSARLLYRYTTWNKRTARLFACDCAERVIDLCENYRVARHAIEVSRRFAISDADEDELSGASKDARIASWNATEGSDRAATFAIISASGTVIPESAADAAWVAAKQASYAAATSAGMDSVRETERKWQSMRLMEYLEVPSAEGQVGDD